MTFVTVRNQDFVMHENPKAKEIASVLFEKFTNKMIAEDIGYESDILKIQEHIKQFANHNRPLDYEGLDHIEVDIPLSQNVEVFDTCIKQVSEFLKLDKESYIGVHIHHFSFNQISHHFKIKKAVKFTNQQVVNQNLPELVHCTFANSDKEIIIMKGMLVHQETLDPTARSMATRILHKLGVNRFVILGDVFAADDEMQVGDIVLPTDHLNMSVISPNIGKNIDEWGKRFYDVSKCYDDALISKFHDVANKQEDINVWKSHIFYSGNSKAFAGKAEKRFCQGIGKINETHCNAVSFQGY
jgi:hypothetical protein